MLDRPRETWGTTWRQRFQVAYDVPVVFTRDAFSPENAALVEILREREPRKRHRAGVLVDHGVLSAVPELPERIRAYSEAHATSLEIAGEILPVPGGERAKSDPALIESLVEALARRAIDRHSYAIAIGGGAVLDAVGFAAAIFHRGVRHVRFPTTVLAQADSGVGVKNAVNALGLKNLVGTFAPPFAVINDACFVDHLPVREKRDGMAEAVKVALIRDRAFFTWLERNAGALARFDQGCLDALIRRSAELHMRQIAQGGDPFESGSARPLDFGHWAAHKLEIMSTHALSHGEAVAIGIALDARYSTLVGLLPAGEDERIAALLRALGFRLWCDALLRRGGDGGLEILAGLRDFREHLGGELTVTLLAGVGEGVEVNAMDEALIEQALLWLRGREGG